MYALGQLCLFVPALCVSGSGVLCLGVAVSLFCLLLPPKSFNMFQFPGTVCVYVCVKRIISACMSVIESAAVEATTSLPPPAALPSPLYVICSFIRTLFHFLFHFSPPLFLLTPSPLDSPSLPTPCNKLTHRKL